MVEELRKFQRGFSNESLYRVVAWINESFPHMVQISGAFYRSGLLAGPFAIRLTRGLQQDFLDRNRLFLPVTEMDLRSVEFLCVTSSINRINNVTTDGICCDDDATQSRSFSYVRIWPLNMNDEATARQNLQANGNVYIYIDKEKWMKTNPTLVKEHGGAILHDGKIRYELISEIRAANGAILYIPHEETVTVINKCPSGMPGTAFPSVVVAHGDPVGAARGRLLSGQIPSLQPSVRTLDVKGIEQYPVIRKEAVPISAGASSSSGAQGPAPKPSAAPGRAHPSGAAQGGARPSNVFSGSASASSGAYFTGAGIPPPVKAAPSGYPTGPQRNVDPSTVRRNVTPVRLLEVPGAVSKGTPGPPRGSIAKSWNASVFSTVGPVARTTQFPQSMPIPRPPPVPPPPARPSGPLDIGGNRVIRQLMGSARMAHFNTDPDRLPFGCDTKSQFVSLGYASLWCNSNGAITPDAHSYLYNNLGTGLVEGCNHRRCMPICVCLNCCVFMHLLKRDGSITNSSDFLKQMLSDPVTYPSLTRRDDPSGRYWAQADPESIGKDIGFKLGLESTPKDYSVAAEALITRTPVEIPGVTEEIHPAPVSQQAPDEYYDLPELPNQLASLEPVDISVLKSMLEWERGTPRRGQCPYDLVKYRSMSSFRGLSKCLSCAKVFAGGIDPRCPECPEKKSYVSNFVEPAVVTCLVNRNDLNNSLGRTVYELKEGYVPPKVFEIPYSSFEVDPPAPLSGQQFLGPEDEPASEPPTKQRRVEESEEAQTHEGAEVPMQEDAPALVEATDRQLPGEGGLVNLLAAENPNFVVAKPPCKPPIIVSEENIVIKGAGRRFEFACKMCGSTLKMGTRICGSCGIPFRHTEDPAEEQSVSAVYNAVFREYARTNEEAYKSRAIKDVHLRSHEAKGDEMLKNRLRSLVKHQCKWLRDPEFRIAQARLGRSFYTTRSGAYTAWNPAESDGPTEQRSPTSLDGIVLVDVTFFAKALEPDTVGYKGPPVTIMELYKLWLEQFPTYTLEYMFPTGEGVAPRFLHRKGGGKGRRR